jgi:hypothetical protein
MRKMFKRFGRFRSFLTLLLVSSVVLSFVSMALGETGVEDIRKDLKSRKSLISRMYTFSKYYSEFYTGAEVVVEYVEPMGIIILLSSWEGEASVTSDSLNLFFQKLGEAFALTKYPPNTYVNIYIQIPPVSSLIVKVPIGAIYDYFKERISRVEFLSMCEIYIDGIKATIEGDTIKTPRREFKMRF